MGIVFFFLTVLVVPQLPSGMVPRMALLSLVAAVLFWKIKPRLWFWAVVGYLTVMALVAPLRFEAMYFWWYLVVLLIVFVYALKLPDLRGVTIGLGLGMTLNSAVVLAQYAGWKDIPQIEPMSGLFYNHNMGAELAAMALVMVIGYRLYWFIPGILPTLYFGSRAAILAIGVAGALALWRWSKTLSGFAFAAAIGLVGAITVHYGQGDIGGIMPRLGVWQDLIPHLTFFGRGLGSFIADYPVFQRHSFSLVLRYENVHNDFLQMTYELGIGAVLLAGAVLVALARAPRSPAWYGFIVFLVEGCFGFPLYIPATGALACVCAGHIFAAGPSLRDVLDRVGRLLRVGNGLSRYSLFPVRRRLFPPGALASVGAGVPRHRRTGPHSNPGNRGRTAA